MSKFKIDDKVKFDFAGSPEEGTIVLIEPCGECKIFDGQYYYRVSKKLLTKIN